MKRALYASTLLATCCVWGASLAAQPPIVGGTSPTALATEAATARAAEASAARYQTAVTARPPGPTDDATQGFRPGSTWNVDDLYTNLISTTGAAGWLRTPNHLLPMDQIGLHVATIALSAAGTGYAVGEVVTLPGGATVTVATITGTATTGPIGTVTLSGAAYHACAITTAGGLAQQASSGAGAGAAFTGTFIGPWGYGARLLTRCYTAGKALDLQAKGTPLMTVNFTSAGPIDYTAVDAAFPGIRPGILTAYDQGINVANATNSLTYAGTISPLRVVHGLRTLVLDGDASIGGTLDSGALNPITTLNFPAAVTINNQANSLIYVGGLESLDHETGFVNVGGNGNPSASLVNKIGASPLQNTALLNGGAGTPCPGVTWDRDNIIIGVNTTTNSLCYQNEAVSASGPVPTAGNPAGGSIGYTYNGAGYAYLDFQAVIVVPWAMSAAEVTAADASIQTTFGIQHQVHNVVAIDGDSDTDGHGSPGQHGWARMFVEMLGQTKPDVKIVNGAFFGSTVGGAASNGAPGSRNTEFPLNIAPVLDAAYAQNAADRWVLMGPMGNNDFNRSPTPDTVAQVESNYQTYCANVHTHHGSCALMYFVPAQGATGNETTLENWIAANAPGTGPGADLVVPITPCPSASLTCTQSDGLHPSPANDYFQAAAALTALAPQL
jgi:hypothetical protein